MCGKMDDRTWIHARVAKRSVYQGIGLEAVVNNPVVMLQICRRSLEATFKGTV